MSFWSKILPTTAIIGSGMIIYGIIEIIGYSKHRAEITHKSDICEICGVTGDLHVWYGISVDEQQRKKQLTYNPESFAVMCQSCREQTVASRAWQNLQKKET